MIEEGMSNGDEFSLSNITLAIFHRALSSYAGRAAAAEHKRLKKLKETNGLDPKEEAKLERMDRRLKNLSSAGGRKNSSKWDRTFDLLVQYEEREGHCDVPQRHVEDGSNLGMWLSNQRKAFRKGDLDKERRQRLGDLGVAWAL